MVCASPRTCISTSWPSGIAVTRDTFPETNRVTPQCGDDRYCLANEGWLQGREVYGLSASFYEYSFRSMTRLTNLTSSFDGVMCEASPSNNMENRGDIADVELKAIACLPHRTPRLAGSTMTLVASVSRRHQLRAIHVHKTVQRTSKV